MEEEKERGDDNDDDNVYSEPCELSHQSNDHFTQTFILSEIFSFLHFIIYSDVNESFINRYYFIKNVLTVSSLNHNWGLPYSSNDSSSIACQAQKGLFIESKSELKVVSLFQAFR